MLSLNTDSGCMSTFHIVFFVLNYFGQSLSPDSIFTDFPPALVGVVGGKGAFVGASVFTPGPPC